MGGLGKVVGLGLALRLALLAYGHWQDENLAVKYSDVDYQVFTDAAAHIVDGKSPYARATYRYTPVIAWMMVPNVILFKSFGKLVFIAIDMAVAFVIHRILVLQGKQHPLFWTSCWMFHPFSVNISTRGNADSIICILLVLTVLFLLQKRHIAAAIVYGLAVHVRIFPIFFAPSILLFLNDEVLGTHAQRRRPLPLQRLVEKVTFGLVAGGVFLTLLAAFYALYGWDFLFETYFYHLGRTDNRHNFSVYFYSLYLHYGEAIGVQAGLRAFLPQVIVQLGASLTLFDDIVLCLCVQTMAFVAFNKVCTAQYFVWYCCLLPLVLASSKSRKLGMLLVALWFLAELAWLYWAYMLEFQGQNVFFEVWASGIFFFTVNLACIAYVVTLP